jgi:uncharacterized membrane protein YraQ (UPF0718 family)
MVTTLSSPHRPGVARHHPARCHNGMVPELKRAELSQKLSMPVLVAAMVAFALLGSTMRAAVDDSDALSTAGTIFAGVFVQALPFLAVGVLLSALIAVFVTPDRLARWLPKRPAAAVLVAAAGGAALPGCECGSVPVARRLFGEGALGAAALTFMLAAPAINPVVVVSTVVAFPGQPQMVFARVGASLVTAIVMGLAWSRWGRSEWITRRLPRSTSGQGPRWLTFTEAARHDFIQAGSYLVIGAAAAAALHVVVPDWLIAHLAGQLLLGVLVMALLAVVLALCSEADAFVAASLTMVPLVPRLVFLVVGPAIDVKLFAMQSGMFGRAFAIRFAPATFVVATVSATVIGLLVLGGGG